MMVSSAFYLFFLFSSFSVLGWLGAGFLEVSACHWLWEALGCD